MDSRPIGIFDSGCGGLTVLKEYLKIMSNENYIYFGDTARLPYGSKSKDTVFNYSKQIVNFLISKNVKTIIIACGTASACAYEQLKTLYDIPIRDIITPTAKAIHDKNIGVIATKRTINLNAWEEAIHKFNKDAVVQSVACPLFVPIVEEGFANSDVATMVAKKYLNNLNQNDITTLILGCTHYPILEDTLKSLLNEKIKIINIGNFSALDTKEFLTLNNLQNSANTSPTVEYYSSDDSQTFAEYSTHFSNIASSKVSKVDISKY